MAEQQMLPVLPVGTKVCIIGAGSAGVYAAKEARAAGWLPTVYERRATLGGVWSSDHHWDSLTTNSSFQMMTVGDFPFPFKPSSSFPTRGEICQYVEAFADHFDLRGCIKMEHEAMSVEPTIPGSAATQWRVASRACASGGAGVGPATIETFGAIFCATGQFAVPKVPRALTDRALNQGFIGTWCHSNHFLRGKDYTGKRVLVLGIGNSALDVALECVQGGAASVSVAARRGAILLPIMADDGQPMDMKMVSRFFESQPKTVRKCTHLPLT
jgi:dimethylaniline monooxygenase (N-oxide forming)